MYIAQYRKEAMYNGHVQDLCRKINQRDYNYCYFKVGREIAKWGANEYMDDTIIISNFEWTNNIFADYTNLLIQDQGLTLLLRMFCILIAIF